MYPETDVPPVEVTQEVLARIKAKLPPPREAVMKELSTDYQLNKKLVDQLVESEYVCVFRRVCSESGVAPSYVATVLTENLKSLGMDGVPVDRRTADHFESVCASIREGEVAKEAAPSLLSWLSKNTNSTVEDGIRELGLRMLSEDELRNTVDRVIGANHSLIEQRGEGAQGKIIGLVMSEVRGSADPATVANMVKARIAGRSRKK